MVVVVASEPPSTGQPTMPTMYATLHRYGGRVCTLAMHEYSWWTLGRTEIFAMPHAHRALEHKVFATFAAAAQYVHQVMFGTRTDYMRSFNVYLSGIPPFRAVCRFSVQQHVRSRATCLFNAAGTDHWCGAIGDTLPLIPPGVLEHEAKALACLHRQKGGVRTEARGPSGAALETEASGPSGAAYQAGNASSIKRQA